METSHFKERVYGEIARIAKALGHSVRLELVELLLQRAWTVEALAVAARTTIGNCSRHLKVLKDAGLVRSRKVGQYVWYELAGDDVARVHSAVINLAERRLADVEKLLRRTSENYPTVPTITREELAGLIQTEEVVLLDVRPEEEFRAAHIDRAASIPLDALPERYTELPTDRMIVAYCRGPVCRLAVDAVRFLHERGFRACRYDESVVDWRTGGLPVGPK